MITIEEAITLFQKQIKEIEEQEEVSLEKAGGRILAEALCAQTAQPPFPRSPYDGYAFCAKDSKGACAEHGVRLRVTDHVNAGETSEKTVGTGEAVRIMTGAPIPAGADTVIKQEETEVCEYTAENGEQGRTILIYKEQKPYENYCFAGEDFHLGDCLLLKYEQMDAVRIGIAASMGYDRVPVKRKVRAAVLSTGSELTCPGEALRPGKIYDSNLFTVSARLRELGCEVTEQEEAEDVSAVMAEKLIRLKKKADLIVVTGGVSVGEKDLVEGVLGETGAEILFHGVCVKPGSPMMGAVLDGTCILCLSGNPFAAMATLEIFLRPILGALTGTKCYEPEYRKGVLAEGFPKGGKHPRYVRAVWENGIVRLPKTHASGVLSSMKGCNCLLEIPAGSSGLEEGENVCVRML